MGSSNSFEWRKIIFEMITSMGIRHAKTQTLRGKAFDETRVKHILTLTPEVIRRDTLCASFNVVFLFVLTQKVLEKFNMKDAEARCQPFGDHFKLSKKQVPKTEASRRRMAKVPYASAVSSVMYVMVCTMPNIAHAVGVVTRFMSNPGREHWEAVKWLLRYLKGTSKATLCFSRKEVVLEGFFDSDYRGCLYSGKSTTGYVFTMGGTTVSWMSRIQKCVAMSTTEAKYMAIAEAGKELVWLKNFLEELDRAQTECVLFCDNQSAIHLAKNPVFHGRTKHIKIRYHYIRELVSEGTLSLKKILGAKNPADMLTKVVTTEKLKLCATSTGLRDN
ncbi:hypothetical protein Tco_1056927 [Tanacetum coccineum]|uniref:Retrovirus-related Pol polyprotein from transposon TNT 1-94 n=1 Tax=Tanacetum coccineum TaxID=301880 RepID=A0ABQ5H4M5_9ASTR